MWLERSRRGSSGEMECGLLSEMGPQEGLSRDLTLYQAPSAGGVENRLEGPDRSRLACEEIASMQRLAAGQ